MTANAPLVPGPDALAEARERLRPAVRTTPLVPSPWLSELTGCPVHLKLECWQRTLSFKIRGALNAVAALSAADRRRGLVTASAGNHGLAVAEAARTHGCAAVIFVPRTAPATKKARIRRAGADLREVDGTYDDAAASAAAHARETGATPVHAFADPAVVAGQGTVGLEILDQLPDVREVVVPVGGGGLAAGVGAALAHHPDPVRALGIQSAATRAMFDAFGAGRVVPSPDLPTVCDGLAGETEPEVYRAVHSVLDDLRLVEERLVPAAIRELYLREGIVAEGAGAVGVAALLAGTWRHEGPVAVVVSGGNIDGERLARILLEE